MVSVVTTRSGSLRDRVLSGVWGTQSPRTLPSRHSYLSHASPLSQGKQGGPRLILMEKLRHHRLQAGFGPPGALLNAAVIRRPRVEPEPAFLARSLRS